MDRVNKMERISIRTKLYAGFAGVLLMVLIMVGIGISRVNYISHALTEVADINSVKQRYAINYRGSVHDRAIAFRDATIAQSSAELDTQKKLIKELRAFYDESEAKMKQMMASDVEFTPTENQILSRIDTIKAKGLVLSDRVVALAEAGEATAAKALVRNEAGPLFAKWLGVINEFIDYQEAENQATTPLARSVADGFQTIMLLIFTACLVISAVVAYYITAMIYNALGAEPKESKLALSEIAEGNLKVKLESKHGDSLMDSLCIMRDKLETTVSDIIRASTELTAQTTLVEDGSKEAGKRASQQAEQTETTLATLSVMKNRLDEIADVANRTEANSNDTNEYSKQGIEAIVRSSAEMLRISETVDATVAQIKKLEATTIEIGSIVNVISSISEQTNLLALNAAIEAARAGESGRGFAVVADEVRELARRTGDATSQIEKMITEVQTETQASVAAMETTQPLVESGRKLTNQTTELLNKIESQANASLSNVKMVASATKEQVDLINQVSFAMTDINSMASESIESLRENMHASETLSKISQDLNKTVKYFSVEEA